MANNIKYSKTKIGVFDSGKGGTLILDAIREELPNEEYMYVGDSDNCPYGEKTEEQVKEFVDEIIRFLLEKNVDAIYIASPHDTHYRYAKKALENKKHVLCEKPLTFTVKEAEEL